MIKTFQNRPLSSYCSLIGYSWLIDYFDLTIPLRELSAISQKRLSFAIGDHNITEPLAINIYIPNEETKNALPLYE